LSDTPLEAAKQDPPQSGSRTATPSTTPAPVATSDEAKASWWSSAWPRIKEHKIAQWTAAYAAFAFVALHGATLLSDGPSF
jgi:hypothetical protein